MERDRQAPWRTCVQWLCAAGMVAGMVFALLEDTIFFEFLPDASDASRTAALFVAVALAAGCSGGYWASLRRLRRDPQD